MYTSNQSQWNMPFGSSFMFDPKKFIKNEVRTLGAIQILIGLTHIFTAINPSLYQKESYSYSGMSGYLVWGGVFFIISGLLSVEAEKNRSSCMVHGSIGMNVVSAIISLAGVFLLIANLCFTLTINVKTISCGLLPFALLEFCLTCVVSHFGCQATCWNQFVNRTAVPTIVIANPANTPTGPFNATDNTTGCASVITSPANPTSPTNAEVMVPPEPSYEGVADFAQK